MPEDARKQALNVHRKLSQAENQGQELNEDQRKWKTAATQIIGDNKLAAKAVEDWYRAHPTSAEARVNRTRILLQEVTTWCRQPSAATLEDMHQSLTQAVDTVPIDQAGMVSAVVLIIGRQRKSDTLIEAFYQRLLGDPKLSGIIVESFGTLAAVEKDWTTADQLLRRATAASPEWGNGWNNWAFVISTAFPDRLNEALRHADQAIQLQPDNPDYRETRGMIHHKLGNYEQAISDLEIAANGINELASVHAALADSHRRLGNRSLAEIYERRALRRAN
jgi:tetratricopeptide (TPR) repeat protein